MRLLLPPLRCVAALLLTIALGSCGDTKNQAYIEKPVDDLYNKAMDALVDENYTVAGKTFDTVESQHPYSVWDAGFPRHRRSSPRPCSSHRPGRPWPCCRGRRPAFRCKP